MRAAVRRSRRGYGLLGSFGGLVDCFCACLLTSVVDPLGSSLAAINDQLRTGTDKGNLTV